MKASNYERRWEGPLPDAILRTLMEYHGCIHHAGANSGACLADFMRADMICDTLYMFKVDVLGFDPKSDAEVTAKVKESLRRVKSNGG